MSLCGYVGVWVQVCGCMITPDSDRLSCTGEGGGVRIESK